MTPCPSNCSKQGMCLSESTDCNCADADRVGTPEERIARALAIGIGSGVMFFLLLGFVIWGAFYAP